MKLLQGDCLEIMPTLEAQSFDAIIADIPYGTTACSWDTVIPFAPMWENLKRLAKPRAAIVLFGSQPFTSALIASNFEMFKYAWVWDKLQATDFANSHYRPMRATEDISVFSLYDAAPASLNKMNYFPQGLVKSDKVKKRGALAAGLHMNITANNMLSKEHTYIQEFSNYPTNILKFPKDNSGEHPTQKPVALMEYLIKTYTNEGDTVLDFTMGSGSTLVAAVNTNRNGVGIELREDYYNIAQRRVQEAQAQTRMELA